CGRRSTGASGGSASATDLLCAPPAAPCRLRRLRTARRERLLIAEEVGEIEAAGLIAVGARICGGEEVLEAEEVEDIEGAVFIAVGVAGGGRAAEGGDAAGFEAAGAGELAADEDRGAGAFVECGASAHPVEASVADSAADWRPRRAVPAGKPAERLSADARE